jgi:hypothetical protein
MTGHKRSSFSSDTAAEESVDNKDVVFVGSRRWMDTGAELNRRGRTLLFIDFPRERSTGNRLANGIPMRFHDVVWENTFAASRTSGNRSPDRRSPPVVAVVVAAAVTAVLLVGFVAVINILGQTVCVHYVSTVKNITATLTEKNVLQTVRAGLIANGGRGATMILIRFS